MKIEKDVVVFADTDFLSSFLRIGLERLLIEVLSDNELRVPYTVAKEINDYHDSDLINRFNNLVNDGYFVLEPEIPVDSEEFNFIMHFVSLEDPKYPIFGEGESEALALAYFNDGYIASNNLKHIAIPCHDFHINYFSSIDILKKAYKSKIKTLDELDIIWGKMKTVQKLPQYDSFSEYLSKGD